MMISHMRCGRCCLMTSLGSIRLYCVLRVRLLRPLPLQGVLFKLVDWWVYQLPWVTLLCRVAISAFAAWQSLRRSVLFTSPRSLYCGMCILACIGMEIIILAAAIVASPEANFGVMSQLLVKFLHPGTALHGTLHELTPPFLEFNAECR